MTLYTTKYYEASFISSTTWDSTTNILLVYFKSGSIWSYFDVPQDIYYSLISAPSTGAYFNKNIRDSYSAEPIERPSDSVQNTRSHEA